MNTTDERGTLEPAGIRRSRVSQPQQPFELEGILEHTLFSASYAVEGEKLKPAVFQVPVSAVSSITFATVLQKERCNFHPAFCAEPLAEIVKDEVFR